MEENKHILDIDIKNPTYIDDPEVRQNDDVYFVINITDDGEPYDLTSVSTITLAVKRNDKVVVISPGEKTDVNQVTFKLPKSSVATVGKSDATVQMYDAENRVSTFTFPFNVVKDPSGDGWVPSDGEKTLIQVVLGEGPRILADAEQATTEAIQAKDETNQVRLDTIAVKDATDAEREATEAVRVATVTAKEEAEGATVEALEAAEYATQEADDARAQKELVEQVLQDGPVASVNGQTGIVTGLAKQEDMDSVTSQLADIVTQAESIESGNAKAPLNIVNYLGNIQNIHPKALFLNAPWNGYYVWMAYTPYPYGDTDTENPCIAVSNDLINWTVPSGLVNPLDPTPDFGYNSDTHLVFREDLNRMEIWWRPHNPTTGETWLYRRTSTDGKTWTPKEELYYAPNAATDPLSPAILFENGKYKMWAVNRGTKDVVYLESLDAKNWSDHVKVPIEWGSLTPWHMDVIRTDKGLEFVVQAWQGDNGNNNAELYYVNQKLDGSYTKPRMILKKSSKPNAFDRVSIYRSTLLKHPHNGQYHLFYTALGGAGFRSIALASGSSPLGLNGFDIETKSDYKFGETFKLETNVSVADYDVNGIDNVFFSGINTIHSIAGGYRGKRLMFILNSSAAVVTIKSSTALQTPKNSDIIMDKDSSRALELVCTNTEGTQFKVVTHTNDRAKFLIMSDDTTLIDYNMSEYDMLLISAPNKQIDSFSGGYIGKRIDLSITGSSAKATLKYSGRLLLPNAADFVLDSSNGLVTLICVNSQGTTWRMVSS